MREEERRREQRIGRRKFLSKVREVRSEEVVRVPGEFVLQQSTDDLVQPRRTYEPKHQPADSFEDTVNSFQRDTGLKRPVQQRSGLRFHWVPFYFNTG